MTEQRKHEEEAWYRQQQLLMEAEEQRRRVLEGEERKLTDQRARYVCGKEEREYVWRGETCWRKMRVEHVEMWKSSLVKYSLFIHTMCLVLQNFTRTHAARLQALKRELKVKELQVLDATRRRFLHHQQGVREAELQRMEGEIQHKVEQRERETRTVLDDIETRALELERQRILLEQELRRCQEEVGGTRGQLVTG